MYNDIILSYLSNPYHDQEMEEPDTCAQEGMPGYGPYMAIYLRLKKESTEIFEGKERVIEEATFQTYHCPAAVACGSWLTKWLEGKTLEQAGSLEWEDMNRVLGGLPLGKEHAAQNAVKALRGALRKLKKQNETVSGFGAEGAQLNAQT